MVQKSSLTATSVKNIICPNFIVITVTNHSHISATYDSITKFVRVTRENQKKKKKKKFKCTKCRKIFMSGRYHIEFGNHYTCKFLFLYAEGPHASLDWIYKSGPSCSKLTTSLVNVSLKFQTLILQIHCYFLLKKCENPLHCKGFSHFFNKK